MKFIIQRVSSAKVQIDHKIAAEINAGLLVYMAIHRDDACNSCDYWIEKILKLRIFADELKPINRSIRDVDGELLVVSQFTLYGNAKDQNRPSFMTAKKPEEAQTIYNYFCQRLVEKWPKTKFGIFAADMQVYSINDGPVTIILE